LRLGAVLELARDAAQEIVFGAGAPKDFACRRRPDSTLITQVETFGFHLARLDFRDHSGKLERRESELLAELWTIGAIQKKHGRTAADHFILSMTRNAQDKLTQKQTLQQAGLAVPQFRAVNSPDEIIAAAKEFDWPLLLKTRRNGYDGKGNFTVRSAADVAAGWAALGGGKNDLMVEAFWRFEQELAVIVTRGRDGTMVVYPVVETIQRNHVCHVVKAPAQISGAVAARATDMARRAIEAVGGVGSFGVELFLSATGELAINELAPRVHNSGHYTIEACDCSQFENHVRAVLGWPLGNPLMLAPTAVMVNLLGTNKASGQPRGLENALRLAGARVHIYASR
jgi:5-(carboxyamino)imidazole ribonucleotide synthase